ncbi:MAG: hypothetical protein KDD67_11870 [Ignavibacteriae bacterium]|nr:hypothetical protein [Ignavibacteriota bacterium]MCB9214929.1 hypothetical protein [Ignavibacteria bacterium]
MNPYLTLCFSSLVLLALFTSCGEGNPANPAEEVVQPLNSITIDGDGWQKTSIVFADDGGTVVYDTVTNITTFEITGTVAGAKLVAGSDEVVKLVIRYSGEKPNTFNWSSLEEELDDDVVVLTIADKEYRQQEGELMITHYGSVGKLVSGTFSGSLKGDSGEEVILLEKGVFSALRKENVGDPDADAPLTFIIDGDGYNNVKVVIREKGFNTIGFAHYNTDGGAHLSFLLGSGLVDVPGHEAQSFAFVFSFPRSYEGVWPWNLGNNSDFSLNISGKIYKGVEGRTGVSYYGRSFSEIVAGYFDGTLRNVETGALIQLKSGKFVTVRAN